MNIISESLQKDFPGQAHPFNQSFQPGVSIILSIDMERVRWMSVREFGKRPDQQLMILLGMMSPHCHYLFSSTDRGALNLDWIRKNDAFSPDIKREHALHRICLKHNLIGK